MSENNMSQMKVLLCTIPDGDLESTLVPIDEGDDGRVFQATLGIQSLVNWMNKKGFDDAFEYYDINNLRPTDEELISRFSEIKPTVVGLSAPLSHCYPNVKRIAAILRDILPDVWIIVGGHVTASAKVILSQTETDICVIGDGEIAWVQLLEYIKKVPSRFCPDEEVLQSILGVAFHDQSGIFQFSGYGQQLPADELNFIDFEFMKTGLHNRPELFRKFFPLSKDDEIVSEVFINKESPFYRENNDYDSEAGGTIASIPTSKGCVAKCTFCQRYTKGYRVYDLDKIEEYIVDLKTKYNVNVFSVADENFGSNKKQAYQVAEVFKKCGVYWQAGGARCTSFTHEDFEFLKENNCIYIKFGIESGSQTILDIMEKKFNRQNVLDAVKNCADIGLMTSPDALMLGMPGETYDTVRESANFIAQLRYIVGLDNNISTPFWATAFPGTPLYEYSQQIGIIGNSIEDEEAWLYRLSKAKTTFYNYYNQTGEEIKTIFFWGDLFVLEGKRAYLENVLHDKISLIEKIKRLYVQCIQPEISGYVNVIASLHNKKSPAYVGSTKSLPRKFMSHGIALVRFMLSLANLILPRAIVFPVYKLLSDLKFEHIKKSYSGSFGQLSLFQEQLRPNKEMLITPERLKKKERQQERSLRSFVRENRSRYDANAAENNEARLSLASGQ